MEIYIQSFVDIITNSSMEVYTINTESTVKAVRALLKSILNISEEEVSERFDIRLKETYEHCSYCGYRHECNEVNDISDSYCDYKDCYKGDLNIITEVKSTGETFEADKEALKLIRQLLSSVDTMATSNY